MTSSTTEANPPVSQLRNLNKDDLQRLSETSGDPCVSILMPTHRRGHQTQQDPIRWKNLLKQATQSLHQSGHEESVLDVASQLEHNAEFWQHQGHGLAVFIAGEKNYWMRLNRSVDEAVEVGTRFLVSPLIREHQSRGTYFVLALSWDQARLYKCDGESLTVVDTQYLPAKMDELVLPRDPEESLQNTSHRSHGGTPVGMFHGQGEGEDKVEADRRQYLSIVGDEVAGAIYNTGLPLVLVATSEVSGEFSATTSIEIDAAVHRSPSGMNEDDLKNATSEVIAAQLKVHPNELIERFETALANSQASSDLVEMIEAAKIGKVHALIVCDTACRETNHAVVETIKNGGDVFRCDAKAMPAKDTKAAAIFRY